MKQSLIVGASIVALATGCNSAKSVAIDPANPTLTETGQKSTLTAVFKNGGGELLEKAPPFTWSSNNSNVATVDAAGVVTAVKSGEASIRLVSEKSFFQDALEATTTVNVSIPSRVTVSDVELTGVGGKTTIKPTVVDEIGRPTSVSAKDIVFNLEDGSIASVAMVGEAGEEREFTATSIGESKALATVGKVTTEFKIVVKMPEFSELKLETSEFKLKAGDVAKIVAKALAGETEATGVPFSYASSNTEIATVDAFGNVVAVATGTATIEVTAGDKKSSATVTIAK